jgi:hypothetical protein
MHKALCGDLPANPRREIAAKLNASQLGDNLGRKPL